MPPEHMLDASACIQLLTGRMSVADLPFPKRVAVSSVVAAELWTGVEKSHYSRERVRVTLLLETFPVMDFDHEAAREYGRIRADRERRGRKIGPLDMLIAAHALSVGATLVTGNADEFRRVDGLNVLAWP